MKKLFLSFACAFVMIASAAAQNVTLNLTSGQVMYGTLIELTDSTVSIVPDGAVTTNPLVFRAVLIKDAKLPHGSRLVNQDGKLILLTKEDIKIAKLQRERMRTPEYLIGKAMKTSGAAALAIGVPCLATGLATCIAGHVAATRYNLIEVAGCLEASYYLLPIGASLTIAGIPLYVEGKKIMELNVNFTGNGAGLALNF